mmetsp:Transcript_22555/g.34092  ORF Transcript_22555/g.34092 Transcript_22555/m.34092 type:complete len:92 (+) Transcript_22555:158-433(+)
MMPNSSYENTSREKMSYEEPIRITTTTTRERKNNHNDEATATNVRVPVQTLPIGYLKEKSLNFWRQQRIIQATETPTVLEEEASSRKEIRK